MSEQKKPSKPEASKQAAKKAMEKIKHEWKEYNETLIDQNYLRWSLSALELIYPGIELARYKGIKLPFLIHEASKNYKPSPGDSDRFNKLGKLLDHKVLPIPDLSPSQRQFYELVESKIHRPLLPGYVLSKMKFDSDKRVVGFEANVSTYENNIKLNHYLSYELYASYKKNKGVELSKSNWRENLPIRARTAKAGWLSSTTASDSTPLISVQAIVIFKDYCENGEPWSFYYMDRSDQVSALPGYRQIPPSGGFEIFANENAPEEDMKRNFHIENAILRELQEEIFGLDEVQENSTSKDESVARKAGPISELTKLKALIKEFVFLGVVTDLTTLRPELTFAIVIDSETFAKEDTKAGVESKLIRKQSIENFDQYITNYPKVCPGTLGLALLMKKNGLLDRLG